MSYEIEKDVPIIGALARSSARFPLEEMEVNDSFVIDEAERRSLSSAIARMTKYFPNKKFITRKLNATTARCWRIR